MDYRTNSVATMELWKASEKNWDSMPSASDPESEVFLLKVPEHMQPLSCQKECADDQGEEWLSSLIRIG
jgi:hypothetical protein